MSASCVDCSHIPKVPNAGAVEEDAGSNRVQIMHNGLRVRADGYYGAWMTELIGILKGHHEPQEEAVFHDVLKCLPANATMLELGGFWSYYTLWFLKGFPERQAVVLEPDPNHLEVGRENARLNGLSPTFIHGSAGAQYISRISHPTESAGEVIIAQYSVEHLLGEAGWEKLNLLHIDIQGAETEVLASCERLFRSRQVDWVFVSTHSHWISGDPLTHHRCLQLLQDFGAIVEVEHDVHESFSGDGLIVARFCQAPMGWHPPKLSFNRQCSSFFRHLAFDLAERTLSLHQAAEAGTRDGLHPDLQPLGRLIRISSPGPLGNTGDTLLVFDDKFIGPQCRMRAEWEIENVERFSSHIPHGRRYTLVDVGANIGLFTRQIVRLGNSIQRIICVEPDQENFRVLKYNLNGIGIQAEFHNFALAYRNGVGELLRDVENTGNYSLNRDAMRGRPFEAVHVETRNTSEWAIRNLGDAEAILWKSDTQGFDELIVSQIPLDIWKRVDVALLEMWRIDKPEYDRDAFRKRLAEFPYRQLGDDENVSIDQILAYLGGRDWAFKDLLMWREVDSVPSKPKKRHALKRWLKQLTS